MADSLTVITNHAEREFIYGLDVPPKVLADDFDWLDEEEAAGDGFIHYRRRWYHIDEFMSSVPPQLGDRYDGWLSDTFFSGVAIKLSDDGETYRIATVIA